ncbi:MAG: phosphatidylcholine synthase [Pseudolabrys sp.]|nr:phosphatidylcholine synthase [Pseudolabrys sp.]MDP2295324.1 phosphatidylcholine synthase [Pseudolabrys sp.]
MFVTVRAFAVHIFTALGAALGLLALIFATGGHWAAMFLALGLALIVDGVDGPMARRFKVREVLPRWSGEGLDFVVDFITYVFVPAYAIAASGYLPELLAIPLGCVIVVTGALYFADGNMKTDDNYFRGFPAVWNLVAFYVFVLEPAPWPATVAILALAALTFAPLRFVHPLRVRHWRVLNIVLMAAWAVLAFVAVAADLSPDPYVVAALSAIALYFLVAGLLRRAPDQA